MLEPADHRTQEQFQKYQRHSNRLFICANASFHCMSSTLLTFLYYTDRRVPYFVNTTNKRTKEATRSRSPAPGRRRCRRSPHSDQPVRERRTEGPMAGRVPSPLVTPALSLSVQPSCVRCPPPATPASVSPAVQVKAEALEDDELDVANDLSGSDNMEPRDMNNAQIENELVQRKLRVLKNSFRRHEPVAQKLRTAFNRMQRCRVKG